MYQSKTHRNQEICDNLCLYGASDHLVFRSQPCQKPVFWKIVRILTELLQRQNRRTGDQKYNSDLDRNIDNNRTKSSPLFIDLFPGKGRLKRSLISGWRYLVIAVYIFDLMA